MSERIIVAMSGGVDSSVAAALLVSQGYEVVGVTLHLWDYPEEGSVKGRCCAPEDIHDARRVADTLGIPHYAFDRRELFLREVVEPFVDSYLSGETPSPCVRCNRGVKIKELFQIADRLGARRIATGHYARVVQQEGQAVLLRALDLTKDQSYFLHMLSKESLARLVFPLGELSKAAVRAEALQRNLPGAQKGESQELCFIPTGRYDSFVEQRADGRMRPGQVLDNQGRVLGEHRGIHNFTIGQRRNLGISVGQRAYVTHVDAGTGAVTLGGKDELWARGAELREFVCGADVSFPLRCEVAVRYRGQLTQAIVTSEGAGQASLSFDSPLQAVVPGQVAVCYVGDRVVGGGVIAEATRDFAPDTSHSRASARERLEVVE